MGWTYSTVQAPKHIEATQHDIRGIIMGFDIGTMSSGVSFALLLRDRTPEIQSVTRFTDQRSPGSRIPSIMYYDRHRKMVATGASAVTESAINNADIEKWTKVERFMMHLRPYDVEPDSYELHLGLLPPSRTAVQVMGDFLRYLYDETAQFIRHHYVDGDNIWKQHRMRQAAIFGGLINDSGEDRARLEFVTEGEANLLSCLTNDGVPDGFSPGYQVILVAGDSILQVTAYEVGNAKPPHLKELAPSICSFSGSIAVKGRVRDLLKEKLQGSRYDNPETLDEIVENAFENSIKQKFSDIKHAYLIRVGSRTDNDTQLGIQRGMLKLTGVELFDCFEPSVREAADLIKQQVTSCSETMMPVWLVGNFSTSPWLCKRLNECVSDVGIKIYRPGIDLSRAVADGCVSYMLHQATCERELRRTAGIVWTDQYDP